MFHRQPKKMITEVTNATFIEYLTNVTEHPSDFPRFVDSLGYLVLPRIAREFGLIVDNATSSINIKGEYFYNGNFSNLAIKDEVSQLVCIFTECKFANSQFKRSQFANVKMMHCSFTDIDFSNSDMRNANIGFKILNNVIFDDADFSEAVLSANTNDSALVVYGCSFRRTNLRHVRIVTSDDRYIANSPYAIYRSKFEGDLHNVTIAGYDFGENQLSHAQVSQFSLSNSKPSRNPFGTFIKRSVFQNVTFQNSTLANVMFTGNIFERVVFDRVNLCKTMWDLGEYEEFPDDDDVVTANVFQNTSIRDVDASNAMLIDSSIFAYGKSADLNAIDGIDYCTNDVIDYFKNNHVTISGNSVFMGANNTFDCSIGIRIAAIGIPFTIVSVIACAIFISRYLGKNCVDRNTIAMNLRFFQPRKREEQNTPLLPLRSTSGVRH